MVAEKISIVERATWLFNTLFHQTYAVVSIFILWTVFYNYQLNEKFSWHVILSTLAYVPLMGEAIILFASDNVWSQKMDRSTKYWIHGIILLISAILVTAGIAIEIDLKTRRHFTSTHAWTGLVSWIFVLLSQFLGLCAAKAQIFSKFIRPVYLKFLHNFLGLLGFAFGVVSLGYGVQTRGFSRLMSDEARKATFWLLGITTVWSCLAAFKSCYNQLKTIIF